MYKGNSSSSRVVPVIIVLVVIAIAIAALVSIGRAIFSGDSATETAQQDIGRSTLLNTSASNSVRMIVRGPIVADENFRSYQITVDSSSRNLTTYSGYLDRPIDSQNLGNNVKAYEEFVYALDKAALTEGTPLEGAADDTRGVCATGNVYEFEVLRGNAVAKRLWTSTCKGSKGSFRASVPQVQALFKAQLPENRALLKAIDL